MLTRWPIKRRHITLKRLLKSDKKKVKKPQQTVLKNNNNVLLGADKLKRLPFLNFNQRAFTLK